MTVNSSQALVGDIGGTNARFAIADLNSLTIAHFVAFPCAQFPSLPVAITTYLKSIPHRPTLASLAVAAPITGDVLHLTNLSWICTREEVRVATGAQHLQLLNDFEALALSLPHLAPDDLHQIGGENPLPGATKAVLGPGTGLGVAGLVASPSGWIGIASEGGHMSFAVEDAEELAIVERLMEGKGHVSAERLISGPGLAQVYRCLGELRAKPVAPRAAPEIVQAAATGADPLAEEALARFASWLGRFSGDIALAFGARGGIYLGGGIAPKILGTLTTGAFRTGFQCKGRMSPFLEPIPVYVITAPDAGLRGAAVALWDGAPTGAARCTR